ncbi:MAG: hypothetical protein A2X08_10450 [Bacteroidetes bacterium GWA2_32_17]|nr:MAG: hypothetical protein A2X08_10450 [Bacteroidetes bacterium GWA2_32_17]
MSEIDLFLGIEVVEDNRKFDLNYLAPQNQQDSQLSRTDCTCKKGNLAPCTCLEGSLIILKQN